MNTAQQRVDAYAKVTGTLRYGADRAPNGLAYAAFSVSTIGKGRVVSMDTDAAWKVPGVHLVITHINPEELRSPGFLMADGYGFESLQPLADDRIAYRGQPIALIVAKTLLAATKAAKLITATYTPEPVAVTSAREGTWQPAGCSSPEQTQLSEFWWSNELVIAPGSFPP